MENGKKSRRIWFSNLRVDWGASEAEIKKEYPKHTKIHHRDIDGGDETKFMPISKALAASSNSEVLYVLQDLNDS